MSSVREPQPSPPRAGTARWRLRLVGWLGPAGSAVALNQLATVLPPVAVGAVILVVAVVYGHNRLDERAPLAEALPRILLYVAVAGVALAVTTPSSWAGPLTLVAVVAIACAALVARDRATALTSLAGISICTTGLFVVTDAVHVERAGARFVGVTLGTFAVVLGLLVLDNRRHLFGADSPGLALLREARVFWSRAGALGVLSVPASVSLAREGSLVTAALVAVAGLCWLGVTLVFVFAERRDALAGALLAVSGTAVTALGLLAFDAREYPVGMIAATAGVAMVGGGISLLESTGALARLGGWLAHLTTPGAQRADG
ncbi:hypothetical protein ACGGAQ_20460 [Micromonospora sp. NPDC047557]|uniref:hypothetical protein n=1 Tax=Micromonospora sp. NPDC047557 TaxID=3364250 RepID=UPI0037179E60